MKISILFIVCLIQINAFSQITNQETDITVKNTKFLVLSKSKSQVLIPENKAVEIYFKDSSQSCKGNLSILNDSSISVNSKQIYLSEILKIKTNLKTRTQGIALLFLSASSAAVAVLFATQFIKSSNIAELIGYGAVVIGAGGLSAGLLAPSIILLSNGVSKYYSSSQWTFTIQSQN